MKKIIFLVPSLGHAGSEKSFLRVANSIKEAGYNVIVIVFSKHLNLENLLNKSIELFLVEGKTSNPIFLFNLKRILKKSNPDIIFGWSLFANLAALLVAPKGKRIIISERNYFPTAFRIEKNFLTSLKYHLTLRAIKWLYPKSDIITANSAINLRFLRLFIGKGPQYALLPNSIDLIDVIDKIKEYQVSVSNTEGKLKIVSVGRLEHQKGFDVLLKSASILKDKIKFKLVIVGDGVQRDNLILLSKQLGLDEYVQFEGFKSNPFPYYSWADIYVLSSRHEGFPNVLVEAMACGKACIATDCQTGPYELTEMGSIGILVKVDDEKDLANAIINLNSDLVLRKQLGERSMLKIKNEYDFNIVKKIYPTILK